MTATREAYLQRKRDLSKQYPRMPKGIDVPADDEPGANHVAHIIRNYLGDEHKMGTSLRQHGSCLYVKWGDEEYWVTVESLDERT